MVWFKKRNLSGNNNGGNAAPVFGPSSGAAAPPPPPPPPTQPKKTPPPPPPPVKTPPPPQPKKTPPQPKKTPPPKPKNTPPKSKKTSPPQPKKTPPPPLPSPAKRLLLENDKKGKEGSPSPPAMRLLLQNDEKGKEGSPSPPATRLLLQNNEKVTQRVNKAKPTKSQLILIALGKLKPMPPPPKSLKFLEFLDSFFVQDSCEPIELWKGFETGSQFVVLDKSKQRLFMATEKTKCLKLCMCRTDRSFMYKLFGKDGKEILRINRPCSCKCCCGAKFFGDLCGHKITVTLEDGSKAGEVVQKCFGEGCNKCQCCCTPIYIVYDCVGNPTLKIKGPSAAFMCCCRMSPCCTETFKVLSLIKDPVRPVLIGEIANNWVNNGTTFVQKAHISSSASTLTIGSKFPPNLDVRTKATVIGAMFLLDFLHYEKEPCCGICQFCC